MYKHLSTPISCRHTQNCHEILFSRTSWHAPCSSPTAFLCCRTRLCLHLFRYTLTHVCRTSVTATVLRKITAGLIISLATASLKSSNGTIGATLSWKTTITMQMWIILLICTFYLCATLKFGLITDNIKGCSDSAVLPADELCLETSCRTRRRQTKMICGAFVTLWVEVLNKSQCSFVNNPNKGTLIINMLVVKIWCFSSISYYLGF